MNAELLADLEAMIRQRFGDLVTEEELALLREPQGLERVKKLLAARCRKTRPAVAE